MAKWGIISTSDCQEKLDNIRSHIYNKLDKLEEEALLYGRHEVVYPDHKRQIKLYQELWDIVK